MYSRASFGNDHAKLQGNLIALSKWLFLAILLLRCADLTAIAADRSGTSVLLGLTGDLLVNRDDPEGIFGEIQPALDDTDILFGNVETGYSDNPRIAMTAAIPSYAPLSNLAAFPAAGFDVVSMANNHVMDSGPESMLHVVERLSQLGVRTVGAGINLAAAREPAIIEKNGLKIAYLAYASMFPYGYEARANFPGLVPMRSHNLYIEPIENNYTPGVPPRIRAVPHAADLKNMKEDIRKAREQADIVVTSFHWGDFQRPFHLTDHEKRIARIVIDEGADIVLGHHHHILRGIEWYKGKPIFYGLGHFVFDIAIDMPLEAIKQFSGPADDPDFYGLVWHDDWPLLPLHPDARMTMLGYALVSRAGAVDDVGFLPARLTKTGHVVPVGTTSDEGRQVIEYVMKGILSQHLNGVVSNQDAITLGGYPTVRVIPNHGES